MVGLVGLIDDLQSRPPPVGLVDGAAILLVGTDRPVSLAGSRWADAVHGHRGGRLPELDAAAHLAVCALVRSLVATDLIAGIHDVADGGLGLTLAEMAARSGVGARISGVADHSVLFGEGPSRVVICVDPGVVDDVMGRALEAGVAVSRIGTAGGDRLVVEGILDVALDAVTAQYRNALPAAMGSAG